MTWLYNVVKYMPVTVVNQVVCDKTDNLEQFPYQDLVSADLDTPWIRWLGQKSWQIAKRRQAWLLRSQIERLDAAIVHSHFGDRGWENLPVIAKTGAKHVVTFYGYDASRLPQLEPIWKDRYAELFEAADLFFCEGPHLGKVLVALGCPEHKVRVQHLGIDLRTIEYRLRDWSPDAPLRVLLAGTFVEKKGFPGAIECLGRIKDKVNLEVTIIGDAIGQERSQHEKARIIQAIEDAGLASTTRLLGYQPHKVMLEEAYRHHVFLSPSITASDGDAEGGAPVSIIEMAASGMPVVSSTHCDIPEVLQDRVSGLLADEGDLDDLTDRLEWLIANPVAWKAMTRAARDRIETEFDVQGQAERLANHYRSLVKGA